MSLQGEFQRKLYKELVKNYNPLERPVANDSQPLTVYFSLSLLQIMDVVSPRAAARCPLPAAGSRGSWKREAWLGRHWLAPGQAGPALTPTGLPAAACLSLPSCQGGTVKLFHRPSHLRLVPQCRPSPSSETRGESIPSQE